MAKVRLTSHAIERISQRGISKKRVKEVIKNSENSKAAGDGKMIARHKGNYDQPVEVIYVQQSPNTFLVVTAYYAS
ncbi:MAG: DUF4258 domain-containing protein [Candidatus Paceibacterota bacterium]